MSEQETSYDALTVGARVRQRAGTRTGTVTESQPRDVRVRWDGDGGSLSWSYLPDDLVVIAPPERAPERVLAPGIVSSADTCDGKPRIAGTGVRTDGIYWTWKSGMSVEKIPTAYGTPLTADQVGDAVTFEAGRSYERERRRARKEKRRARRFLAGKAAAEKGNGNG